MEDLMWELNTNDNHFIRCIKPNKLKGKARGGVYDPVYSLG